MHLSTKGVLSDFDIVFVFDFVVMLHSSDITTITVTMLTCMQYIFTMQQVITFGAFNFDLHNLLIPQNNCSIDT